MNKFIITLLILISVLCACREPGNVQVTESDNVISGEITIQVKEDIILPPVAFKPDIEALRIPGDTSEIRMVAFGGSLPAGSRNGGLYREGQLTSVPQLIAHQMQLRSFVSPLFNKEDGNGSGYLLFDRNALLPTWKQVTNNLGVLGKNPYVLSKYLGAPVDNISWPQGPGSTSDSVRVFNIYPTRRDYFTYLYRFYDKRGEWARPFDYFVDSTWKKTNLVLNFDDMDQYIGMASYSGNLLSNVQSMLHEGYFKSKSDFIQDNLEKGRKIILFNQPDYLDFPFFHLYSTRALMEKKNTKGVMLEDSALLIPNDHIKKAFLTRSPDSFMLTDQDVLSLIEIKGLRTTINFVLNQNTTSIFAKTYKVPMVDLYTLYKKILDKKYYTEDGLFIDPSFPNGNFFSDDGIHPTAIGNAVIANETIIEINKAYKTKIPLINVSELVKRL